ncbi:MAG: dienelactone hydrolase family protein [Lactobacillus sp.]|jgi:predicted esterase|nr:dienelactone hydrolase family protein [Lactobacillus sp.]
MTPIREEIVHVNGHPKKMIMFLHGYIDDADTIDARLQYMIDNLDDVVIRVPLSPYCCEVHEGKKQWYSMHRFDPNDDRKFVKTMNECAACYDKMGLGLMEAYSYLKPYMENCLNEYELEEKDLFICGFSQGATLAIYSSLLAEDRVAGCVSFGGMIAPHSYLLKNYLNTPDFLLIHGDQDNLVRYDALEFTKKHLKGMGSKVETLTIKDENHRISDEGVRAMVKFIKKRMG